MHCGYLVRRRLREGPGKGREALVKGFTEKTQVSTPDPRVFHTLQTGRYPYSHPSSSSKPTYATRRPSVHCPPVANCPAAPVMHFPNEVWLQIFSFLQFRLEPGGTPVGFCPPWPVSSLALAKLSRVCKRFNALAVPLLYHTVPISYPFVRFPLARTLIKCPHLAELVQEAAISVQYVRDSELSDALEAALEECPEHMAPFFQYLLGRYRRQECGAADHVAFFLRMLPNLRVAELEVDMSSQTMLEMLTAWGSSLLPQIEDLRPGPYRVQPRPPGRELDYLIQLPSLRTWHGPGVLWYKYRGPPLGLRHLCLSGAPVLDGGIENILSRCVHLETLQIDMEGLESLHWRFSLAGDALRKLGQTLEKLCLAPLSKIPTESMGSLRTLSRLKQLTIPWEMLGRWTEGDSSDEAAEGHTPALLPGMPRLVGLLPDSLEHLHLYLRGLDVAYGKLLELVRSGRFSKLQSVRLTRKEPFDRDRDSHIIFRKQLWRLGWVLHNYEEGGSGPFRDLVWYGIVLTKKQT